MGKYFDNESKLLRDNHHKIISNKNTINKIYITDDTYKIRDTEACQYIKQRFIEYMSAYKSIELINIQYDNYCSIIFKKHNHVN